MSSRSATAPSRSSPNSSPASELPMVTADCVLKLRPDVGKLRADIELPLQAEHICMPKRTGSGSERLVKLQHT